MTDQHPDQTRYLKAMHAVQTGTALEHAAGSPDGQPKHLRVGITSTQITDAALAGLLIERGLFTLEEYRKAIADEAEMAQARYELRLGVNLV